MTDQRDESSQLQRALIALKEMRARLEAIERTKTEPIAIIGMGCRFPGGVIDPESYWRLLSEGQFTVKEVPPDRWDLDVFYDPDENAPGKTYTRHGSFLDQVDQFDPLFFGISPREATTLDPQQRLLLETSWEALENAGLAPDKIAHSQTGIFMGAAPGDYFRMAYADHTQINSYSGTGTNNGALAGRLSYELGVHGPSFAVDTACSSALVAVHLACGSLRRGESDMALAGGVNVLLSPEVTIGFSKAQMMGADGVCKTFDADANGYVRGEGCGVFVLKRLSDATADGDNILAVIRGTAVNQDGRSNGLTAPNGLAQEACIRSALADGKVKPAEVSYVEAHGTGTPLGDPIEVEALGEVFSEGRSPDTPLIIGSVKTNIGHLETASGAAGLMKVILSLQHQEIPPHLHFKTPNPLIPWERFPLVVPTERTPWTAINGRRIAGVSSYGFGGTNAHIIVEQAPEAKIELPEIDRPRHLLTLSAKNEAALRDLALRFEQHLASHPEQSLADVCFTANTGRAQFAHRLAVVAESSTQAREALTAFAAGQQVSGISSGQVQDTSLLEIAFLFTGQGSQYVGMGRQLYETQPTFRAALDKCDELLRPYLEQPLLSVLYPETGTSPIDETAYTQPALFAVEYALAQLWQSWGIKPTAVMGHSVGEYVAACVAGVFSLEDGLKLIAERGRLMQSLPKEGSMASIQATEAEVRDAIAPYAASVSLGAINGPRSIVISGESTAVQTIVEQFAAKGVKTKALVVSHAFHSPLMEPILDRFEQVARQVTYHKPQISVISNLTGKEAGDDITDPTYWRRHIRQAVRFADAIETLCQQDFPLFLEVGPSPTLLGMGRQCVPEDVGVWLPSLRKGRDDWQQMLASLGALYIQGIELDGKELDHDYPRRRVWLPTYPFQRQSYWLKKSEQGQQQLLQAGAQHTGHPLLGYRLRSFLKEIQFENQLSTEWFPFLNDHQIYGAVVVPGAAFTEFMLAAATALGPDAHQLENVTFQEPLIIPEQEVRTVQIILSPETADQVSFQLVSLKENDEWRIHATGMIKLIGTNSLPLLEEISLESVKERFHDEIDVQVFYEHLREIGLDYGPHFQGAVRLWRNDTEALGEIRLPEEMITDEDEYHFNPALMDACLHPGLLHCTLPWLGVPDAEETEGHIYIPMGFERVRVHSHVPSRVWSYVSTRPDKADSQQVGGQRESYIADMRFYDETGQLVAEVIGMFLKRAPREALLRAIRPNFDNWLYEITWETKELPAAEQSAKADQAGSWLIFTDQATGVGAALADKLQAKGEQCVLVRPGEAYGMMENGQWHINPAQPDDFDRLLNEALPAGSQGWRGLVHLWSADLPALSETNLVPLADTLQINCGSTLHLVQALAKNKTAAKPGLWLVTRGSQPVENGNMVAPLQATVWGMGHTIALEHPDLRCVRVDLEPTAVNENVALLFEELWADDSEDRVAFRSNNRYVARLVRSADRTDQQPQLPDQPFVLDITERGVLDNLYFRPTPRRSPEPGEVEIRVRATGVNFRDVLKALGMYPGPLGPFGDECAGDVVAVGEGVEHLKVGDRVFGMAPGSFSQYVTTVADFVVPMPERLTYEEAATICTTFATAYYALHHCGKMSAGERVLVHAAAGGVGVAAVQLAQRAGLEVYGTASPGKWEFLRSIGVKHIMNSRTLDFSDEILADTDGQGVDLVLNSLTGDFIPKSLAAMTDNGRFLEIGKVGIWSKEQVADVKPDASYDIIFLDDVRHEEPALMRAMLIELADAFAEGSLQPLPQHLFPIENVSDAFRFMAHAKHVGKIVATQPAGAAGYGLESANDTLLHPDATYLITGGLGGLGLTVAKWMASRGAQHLVLVGRSKPSAAAQEVLDELEEAGVTARVAKGDIVQQADVHRVLQEISESMPPLRGIVHAAGVLEDGILLEQNWSRFTRALAPKVDGSWNLHALTRTMSLDFFVLFSSITSVIGSAGQSNYVAANIFMDVLAAQRRLQGRAAISISWGPWAEVGMIAGIDSRLQQRWSKQGMNLIIPEQGMQALEQVLQQAPTHVAALPMDWTAYLRTFAGQEPPFLARIAHKIQAGKPTKPAAAQGPDLLKRLSEAEPDKRRSIVVDHIRTQARMVFGLAPDYPISERVSFNELGLDSLMAVELRNALGSSTRSALPATLLFDYPTLATLADYLVQDVLALDTDSEVVVNAQQKEEDEQAEDMAELAEMSDEEANALLMSELLSLKDE